jgi:transposase
LAGPVQSVVTCDAAELHLCASSTQTRTVPTFRNRPGLVLGPVVVGSGVQVLTDAQWAVLEPLIDEVQPHFNVPHEELRQTIEAIFWRYQNGAKWRSIPAELGPWWKAAQTFIRWAKLGVWERLLEFARQRGTAVVDGSSTRAHHKAAGAARKGADSQARNRREALGRPRGGYGTPSSVISVSPQQSTGSRAVGSGLCGITRIFAGSPRHRWANPPWPTRH